MVLQHLMVTRGQTPKSSLWSRSYCVMGAGAGPASDLGHKWKQPLLENNGWEMLSIEEALASLEQKPELPSVKNFICILQKCRKRKNVQYAKRLYIYMLENGLEAHRALGNYLVPMLVDCGNLCDAQQVFNRLVHRNEYAWTSLIEGYVGNGESQHALDLLLKMQGDCVQPNRFTFVALLKACVKLKSMENGQKMHDEIAKAGLERDLCVCISLVDMYAKCGSLAEAQEVFDELPIRDVVSWTALIAGYAENGLGNEALNCFQHMEQEGMSPNAVTFACSLKACASLGAIDSGQEIHAGITKQGFDVDTFVGNNLVDMYAKSGLLEESYEVFDKLPTRNVFAWTALIAGYAEHGLGDEALKCFKQMQLEGISPDAVVFVCTLKACSSIQSIDMCWAIHTEIVKQGYERENFVCSTLVDLYAKCGSLAEAHEIFYKLPVRDVVLWTALITGYAEHGLSEKALSCFEQMQLEGISPNAVTFLCCVKSCGSLGAIQCGQEIHAEIAKESCETDCIIGSTLVDLYVKCGSVLEAQEVFNKMPIRDVVSWNSLIAGYAEYGLGELAMDCFQQMQLEGVSPDVVSWSALISGCAEQGELGKALKLYTEMQEQCQSPSHVTFVSILKACGNTAALETGKKVHAQVHRVGGFEATEVVLATALIDMYCRCGSMVDAEHVFHAMSTAFLVTWNALIMGYARQGACEAIFHWFERMRDRGIQPDGITYLGVLIACCHGGLVDKGQQFFEAMIKEYSIAPTIKHYGCMVDLISRAGQLDKVAAILRKMPFEPDLVLWSTVLGGCQKWGNVELGKRAFECAVSLDEEHVATYVSMSNIYAFDHIWENAMEIKAMKFEKWSWKEARNMWTEIG